MNKLLTGRNLLRIRDLQPNEISYLVDLAQKIKKHRLGHFKNTKHKKAVCFFSKSSSRTKSAWEVACFEMGMGSSYNDANSSQLGIKESIQDSAEVFSRFYDVIGWRCMKYADIKLLSEHAGVPVINLLCDQNHPTQAICDLLTIKEHFGTIKGVKLAFVGACNNNVARSLIEGLLSLGGHYVGIGPRAVFPDQKEMKFYQALAKQSGGSIKFSTKISDLKGCQVIYQDVFLDLGESTTLWPTRLKLYQGYQVNQQAIKYAHKDFIYMHCLPAINGSPSNYANDVKTHFGKQFPYVKNGEIEVAGSVFYSKHAVVYQQAVNRLYAIKAIFAAVIK